MDQKEKIVVTVILVVLFFHAGIDVLADIWAGSTTTHVLVETTLTVLVVLAVLAIWTKTLRKLRFNLRKSIRETEKQRQHAQAWRQEAAKYLAGLGEAIDLEMERWGLTPSEKEVALLLLKGLSIREIAQVREVSEKTVRHQSIAVYKKGGIRGRADLAAYFLEDLLLPSERHSSMDV